MLPCHPSRDKSTPLEPWPPCVNYLDPFRYQFRDWSEGGTGALWVALLRLLIEHLLARGANSLIAQSHNHAVLCSPL